jgi:putative hemolysin
LETQTDPYPSLQAVGHMQNIAADQLFIYFIIIIIALIFLALLSAAEKAILRIRENDIADLKKADTKQEEKLLKLLDQPMRLQAALSISITFLLVIVATILNIVLHYFFQTYLSYNVEIFLFSLFITLVLLKTATFIPGLYATRYYLKYSRWIVGLLSSVQWLLKPIIELYFFVFKILNKLVPKSYRINEEEMNRMNDSDLINEEDEAEQMILKGIANFGNISVKQVMRNRMDVVAIDIEMEYKAVDKKIKDTRYSRLPVFDNNLDTIKGILYVKDLLINRDELNLNWKSLIRPAYFVPEYKKIDDLLKEFRTRHTHIAIVVDEHGGTSGIVTLEDILEEIVGDISDEYDEADDELRYSKLDENNYVFDGKTPLTDIYKLLNIDEETFDDTRGEADTIGGLVLAIAGRFVLSKERITFQNFIFTVESADRRRVKRVKLTIVTDDEKNS